MGYYDWVQGFRNFYIQERVNEYGKRPKIFVDISKEAQEDIKVVRDFEYLDKGCQLWVLDERYPIRGNTPGDKVATLTQFKKMVPMWINFLRGESRGVFTFKKKSIVQKGLIVIASLLYSEFFITWIWYGLQEIFADPIYYGQPTREVYRLIENDKMRDIICAVLEYDTAYRYRFQDLMGELNKNDFEKNPYREIARLMAIGVSRECHPGDNKGLHALHKIKKILPLFLIYLRINRKLLKEIKRIVREIDIKEVTLSVEDIYWTNRYPDYNFRGKNYEERIKEYEVLKRGT